MEFPALEIQLYFFVCAVTAECPYHNIPWEISFFITKFVNVICAKLLWLIQQTYKSHYNDLFLICTKPNSWSLQNVFTPGLKYEWHPAERGGKDTTLVKEHTSDYNSRSIIWDKGLVLVLTQAVHSHAKSNLISHKSFLLGNVNLILNTLGASKLPVVILHCLFAVSKLF